MLFRRDDDADPDAEDGPEPAGAEYSKGPFSAMGVPGSSGEGSGTLAQVPNEKLLNEGSAGEFGEGGWDLVVGRELVEVEVEEGNDDDADVDVDVEASPESGADVDAA